MKPRGPKKKIKNTGGKICSPQIFVVNLEENKRDPPDTFMGYKTKNINQLWRWDTLEDVKF